MTLQTSLIIDIFANHNESSLKVGDFQNGLKIKTIYVSRKKRKKTYCIYY